MAWTVYILHCADGTLYTGITNDIENRLLNHSRGTGARYTRGRGPFTVKRIELYETKSDALKREAKIKTFSKQQKLDLCA